MALALCDRCPCFVSLHPPQAALDFAAFDKILPKTAHSSRAPRTQFWAKFPCMCPRRRRMSAVGDDFENFARHFHYAYVACAGLRRYRAARLL